MSRRATTLACLAAMLVLGCEASLGGRTDAGRRDGGGIDATTAIDATTGIDATAIDAPPATDAPPAIDAPLDGGYECRPEPRDCSPSAVTMEDYCIFGTSCYVADVQASVREVIATHPEWFDSTGSCDIVLDGESYMDAVVAALVARGLCAIRDPNAPGEEVTVKYTNVFTENFDILASTGCARYGGAIYTSTCFPAWW